jgi:hypothetical protein
MNERIQELMIEAFQSHYGDPVTPVAREKAVELVSGWGEKFAELIVKECASIANYHSDGHYHDQFNRKLYQYHTDIGKEIVDYFGVEE